MSVTRPCTVHGRSRLQNALRAKRVACALKGIIVPKGIAKSRDPRTPKGTGKMNGIGFVRRKMPSTSGS